MSNDHHHNDAHEEDIEFDGFSLEEIENNFKALANELKDGGTQLDELVEKAEKVKDNTPPYFRGYQPDINDYLARAKTREECEEIIEYCFEQGDITEEEANEFLDRLEKGGPRAFGSRDPGYYDQKLKHNR